MKLQPTAMALTFLMFAARAVADTGSAVEREALDAAKQLVHSEIAGLRIILTGIRPGYISDLAEAWTVRDAASGAGVILVFTGSQTFRCAMAPRRDYQCTIKLASILTHESWHLRYGADERLAYDQQLVFLVFHGASPRVLDSVRRARHFVIAPPS